MAISLSTCYPQQPAHSDAMRRCAAHQTERAERKLQDARDALAAAEERSSSLHRGSNASKRDVQALQDRLHTHQAALEGKEVELANLMCVPPPYDRPRPRAAWGVAFQLETGTH